MNNRIPVTSSNIASVGYDQATSTLEIEFLNGTIYQYFDVPQSVFDAFLSAQSAGQYFNAQIKGSFRYAKG